MEKLTYNQMGQEMIMDILCLIVKDVTDEEIVVDMFYDITEEFFTFSGMKKEEAIILDAFIRKILVNSAIQLNKINENNLVD